MLWFIFPFGYERLYNVSDQVNKKNTHKYSIALFHPCTQRKEYLASFIPLPSLQLLGIETNEHNDLPDWRRVLLTQFDHAF